MQDKRKEQSQRPMFAMEESATQRERPPAPLPNYTLSTVCPACGEPTFRRACKVHCPRCGPIWDCSEL